MTSLKISKDEMQKIQKSLDDTKEHLNIKERDLNMANESESQHHKNYQPVCDGIKELKEKLKGDMSLIQAKEIIQNDIIE